METRLSYRGDVRLCANFSVLGPNKDHIMTIVYVLFGVVGAFLIYRSIWRRTTKGQTSRKATWMR